jgi:hypothetical protein
MTDLNPADFALFGEWLAGKVNGCTCAGGTPESSYIHEPHCGWEPLITLSRIQELEPENERLRAQLDDLRAGYQTVCDYAEQVDQLRAQRQAVLKLCDQYDPTLHRVDRYLSVRAVRAALGENPE